MAITKPTTGATGWDTAVNATIDRVNALDQVDNTSDLAKPLSTAQQAALDAKAALSHSHPTAGSVTASSVGVAPTNTAAQNSTALQAWIDSVAGSTAASRALLFDKLGLYPFNTGITLNSGGYTFDGQHGGRKDDTATGRVSTTLQFVGDGAAITNGTDDGLGHAVSSNYNGPEGHTFRGLTFTHGGGATTMATLANGGGQYGLDTYWFRDWRGGEHRFEDITVSQFDYSFWGLKSDVNLWVRFRQTNCRRGLYLGTRSDQQTFIDMYMFGCDTWGEIDGAQGVRFFGGQIVDCGTTSIYGLLLNARYRSTTSTHFFGTWFEHTDLRAPAIDAFVRAGDNVGGGLSISGLLVDSPNILTNATTPGIVNALLSCTGFLDLATIRNISGTGARLFQTAVCKVSGGSSIVFESNSPDYMADAYLLSVVSGAPRLRRTLIPENGTAAPTSGAHQLGAFVRNSAPAAGAPWGWVCTATGTPGTWLALAPLGVQALLDAKAPLNMAVNTQTASYAVVLADNGRAVEYTGSAAGTITIPAGVLPVGAVLEIVQTSTGQVTIAGASGVTVRTASSSTTRAQWSVASVRQRAADEWILTGDLT